ncbi:MAG: GIY-YIG nuclease family protein [Fidelibacterota bacterium]
MLYSESIDRFYIGISSDPDRRLDYHNSQQKGWTRRGRPWQLVYMKEYQDRHDAQHWENWLKRQKSRGIIEQIVSLQIDK